MDLAQYKKIDSHFATWTKLIDLEDINQQQNSRLEIKFRIFTNSFGVGFAEFVCKELFRSVKFRKVALLSTLFRLLNATSVNSTLLLSVLLVFRDLISYVIQLHLKLKFVNFWVSKSGRTRTCKLQFCVGRRNPLINLL